MASCRRRQPNRDVDGMAAAAEAVCPSGGCGYPRRGYRMPANGVRRRARCRVQVPTYSALNRRASIHDATAVACIVLLIYTTCCSRAPRLTRHAALPTVVHPPPLCSLLAAGQCNLIEQCSGDNCQCGSSSQ